MFLYIKKNMKIANTKHNKTHRKKEKKILINQIRKLFNVNKNSASNRIKSGLNIFYANQNGAHSIYICFLEASEIFLHEYFIFCSEWLYKIFVIINGL